MKKQKHDYNLTLHYPGDKNIPTRFGCTRLTDKREAHKGVVFSSKTPDGFPESSWIQWSYSFNSRYRNKKIREKKVVIKEFLKLRKAYEARILFNRNTVNYISNLQKYSPYSDIFIDDNGETPYSSDYNKESQKDLYKQCKEMNPMLNLWASQLELWSPEDHRSFLDGSGRPPVALIIADFDDGYKRFNWDKDQFQEVLNDNFRDNIISSVSGNPKLLFKVHWDLLLTCFCLPCFKKMEDGKSKVITQKDLTEDERTINCRTLDVMFWVGMQFLRELFSQKGTPELYWMLDNKPVASQVTFFTMETISSIQQVLYNTDWYNVTQIVYEQFQGEKKRINPSEGIPKDIFEKSCKDLNVEKITIDIEGVESKESSETLISKEQILGLVTRPAFRYPRSMENKLRSVWRFYNGDDLDKLVIKIKAIEESYVKEKGKPSGLPLKRNTGYLEAVVRFLLAIEGLSSRDNTINVCLETMALSVMAYMEGEIREPKSAMQNLGKKYFNPLIRLGLIKVIENHSWVKRTGKVIQLRKCLRTKNRNIFKQQKNLFKNGLSKRERLIQKVRKFEFRAGYWNKLNVLVLREPVVECGFKEVLEELPEIFDGTHTQTIERLRYLRDAVRKLEHPKSEECEQDIEAFRKDFKDMKSGEIEELKKCLYFSRSSSL